MKIVGGIFRGRKIRSVKEGVRPSTGYVKKRYFDILGNRIVGSLFLDAFSGTGAVGIEALGRGADFVVFIDNGYESLKVIRNNLEKLEIPVDRYLIIDLEYNRAVRECERRGLLFDLVYIDPPFVYYRTANPLRILFKRKVLKPDALIALERPREESFKAKYFPLLREFKTRSSIMDFYVNRPMDEKPQEEEGGTEEEK